MISIFKNSPYGLVQLDATAPGTWIHVVNPVNHEIARLRDEFGVPESFIAAALDADELARIDREDDTRLIILLVPYVYADPSDVPYDTVPLGIVVTREYLITVCRKELPFITDFGVKAAKPVSTAKRNRLVLQLFYATAQTYLAYLRQIDLAVESVQRKLQRSLKNNELLDLLRYQKSLTYFRTGLELNGIMMRRLQKTGIFETYPDDEELLEDVLVENAQATEMTKISGDILSQMMDAFASLISNNLNDVMKILAVATIILSIPTVIASLYGMNVPLPGQDVVWSFAVIVLLSLMVSASLLFVFWRRDWL
jgi:magnesium transporter